MRDSEYYIQNYHKLPKADKNRVVVSFTASEKELSQLKPFINSILDQSVRVDDIALTIPYKDMGKVPKNLKKILGVYGISKSYSANNLIPAVLREPEATTKIIIVEPNMVYGQDFVADMVDASNSFPDDIIQAKNRREELVKPAFYNDGLAKGYAIQEPHRMKISCSQIYKRR